jgi:hypothetical protein
MPIKKLAHKNWAELSQQWGVRWQQAYRAQPILKQFIPMLDYGLCVLTQEELDAWIQGTAHVDTYKLAVYPTALAYDVLHEVSHRKEYATFCWSGILHDEPRTHASCELYAQLDEWKCKIIAQGDTPKITILAHSHGGNVALKLALQETLQQKGLSIDTLVLWGTPIQEETVYFVESPFFKTIISCYTPFDFIQKGDGFSTRAGKSHQRMSDKVNCAKLQQRYPELRRVDIELQVNESSIKVDHGNMWLLGKSQSLAHELKPLPYMILTPILKKLVSECSDTHVYANVMTHASHIHVHIHDKPKIMKKVSSNLKTLIETIRKDILKKWNPDEKHSGMVFSKANPLNYLF